MVLSFQFQSLGRYRAVQNNFFCLKESVANTNESSGTTFYIQNFEGMRDEFRETVPLGANMTDSKDLDTVGVVIRINR